METSSKTDMISATDSGSWWAFTVEMEWRVAPRCEEVARVKSQNSLELGDIHVQRFFEAHLCRQWNLNRLSKRVTLSLPSFVSCSFSSSPSCYHRTCNSSKFVLFLSFSLAVRFSLSTPPPMLSVPLLALPCLPLAIHPFCVFSFIPQFSHCRIPS